MTQTAPAPLPLRTLDGLELPEPGTYEIDASHSHVGFSVRHAMVAKVRGRFAAVSGAIVIAEDPTDSSVSVDIDLASIDTRDQARDEHLRSPDFFDVESHRSMAYRSTGVRHLGENRYEVEGELTIRGVTRAVSLQVSFEGGALDPWGNGRVGFSATAEIQRDDFGLTWNQALETGGVLVGKKVGIDLEIEAVKA